jgi:hypothetical protein
LFCANDSRRNFSHSGIGQNDEEFLSAGSPHDAVRGGEQGLAGGNTQGRLIEQMGLTSDECYRYCLSLPVTTQVVGITTMAQLKADVALARNFKQMTPAEMNALRERVREQSSDGRHELFKSTQVFDGPHHRKHHGFALA